MRLASQLIASGLALIVAAAGWIGLSPELHVRLEHAGVGPAHTHSHPTAGTSARSSRGPQGHVLRARSADFQVRSSQNRPRTHEPSSRAFGPSRGGRQARGPQNTDVQGWRALPDDCAKNVVHHSIFGSRLAPGQTPFGQTGDVVRWLARIVVPQSPPDHASPDSPGSSPDHSQPVSHRHDGLTQLLNDGSVETAHGLDAVALPPTQIFLAREALPDSPILSAWFAPTAPRAPPAFVV